MEKQPNKPVANYSDLIKKMPFSKEIKQFLTVNSEVEKALKLIYERFSPIFGICISYPRELQNHEVVGLFVWDCKCKIFKQDFLVRVPTNGKYSYFLYTDLPANLKEDIQDKTYIKGIEAFFDKYSRGGLDYTNAHHPVYVEIPDVLKPFALKAKSKCESTNQ